MNKYDFDLKNFEEVLYEILGISDLFDINSVKAQLKKCFTDLNKALNKKHNSLSRAIKDKQKELLIRIEEIDLELKKANLSDDEKETLNDEKTKLEENLLECKTKIETLNEKRKVQVNRLNKELVDISSDNDIDSLIKKYITVKAVTLLSINFKEKNSDTEEEKNYKKEARQKVFAVTNTIRNVESIKDFVTKKSYLLNYIDEENKIIKFSTTPPNINESDSKYPFQKLYISFNSKPILFPTEYRKVFEEAGIEAYRFGNLECSRFPDSNGKYHQNTCRKEFIGIIKTDEFGVLQKYTVLMEMFSRNVPPEFYRDILFSDEVLRNSKNNLGFLGALEKDSNNKYGYKLVFSDLETKQFLRIMYFEKEKDYVSISSNSSRINSIKETYKLMEESMEKIIDDKLNSQTVEDSKSIGDE